MNYKILYMKLLEPYKNLQRMLLLLIFIYILLLYTFGCSSPLMKKDSNQLYTLTIESNTLTKSKDRIDNTPTYEIYFQLSGITRCIEISIIATNTNNKRVRCGYILEAEIDISRFPKKPLQPIYTQLAKNFDSDWRFQSNIFFCSNEADPLKRLNPGNYRLRITAFSDKKHTFTIQIKSSASIKFKNLNTQ